jgi:hypothetical protein
LSLDSFITKFGGWSEEYKFYNNTITLWYDGKEHRYYLLNTETEELEPLNGVTNVCHIIDRSDALIPWGCKMFLQKLLRTMPFTDSASIEDGQEIVRRYTMPMLFDDFEKLASEAKVAHKEKLEDAGEVGHTAHAWIEKLLKLKIEHDFLSDHTSRAILDTAIEVHLANMPKDERARKACEAALDWMIRHNVRWISTERKIYSRTYKYAGTADGLCTCDSCYDPLCCPEPFKDRLSVADWKTSNYLYMEYLFQTAAYQQAIQEEDGIEISDRWIIRLGKEDGEFEAWHREAHTFDLDLGGFLDALKLTRTVAKVEANLKERRDNIRAALKAERDEARRLKDEAERAEKALAKEKKAQERLEALALACKASERYKGLKKSSCKFGKDGGPCVSCAFRYAKAQEAKTVGVVTTPKSSKKPKPDTQSIGSLLAVLPKKAPLLLMAVN